MDNPIKTKVWAPTDAQQAQIDRQIRAERSKAAVDVIRFVRRKASRLFDRSRAPDRVRMTGGTGVGYL